jgi:ribonuclease HI/probable phosphoglycerate mutase
MMAEGALKLYTDGACRGNPGYGGAGAVLVDEEGNTVASVKKALGICTNNIAEYSALILGLEEALKKQCRRLHIFLDSELLVRQINGSYRVKSAHLKMLMQNVQRLLKSFDEYTVEHVARSYNRAADRLANEAIDESSDF